MHQKKVILILADYLLMRVCQSAFQGDLLP